MASWAQELRRCGGRPPLLPLWERRASRVRGSQGRCQGVWWSKRRAPILNQLSHPIRAAEPHSANELQDLFFFPIGKVAAKLRDQRRGRLHSALPCLKLVGARP